MGPWNISGERPCRRSAIRILGGAGCRIPGLLRGDIKGCFDNINHHLLLDRLRQRVADRRMTRLVGQFLKAGVMSEDQFLRTDAGTPQGGIISPLLANIALTAIEERYERWTYHRTKTQARRKSDGVKAAASARDSDRIAGRCIFLPVRYADDCMPRTH